MKKFTLALIALLSMTCVAYAQQYVSTTPANRNVILEEFTGRNCGYCPDGHRIANEIMANNPGRVWAINVHAGSYAPTSYPNFNTTVSTTILSGFSVDGFPTGVVNRSTSNGQNRGVWAGLSNQQMAQAAECNVAGLVRINPGTRTATVTVEVYYTGNSTVDQNYLTVAMLQDSIMGGQSNGSTNPSQWVNGTYCHMHILRDMITPAWGDAISPTTQGTLITKTYEYQIPEVIGNPNGVEVKLEHIFFLAWVSERYQGTPTRPILNACELEKTIMTDEPIYPSVTAVSQVMEASCSQTKNFAISLTNIGTENLTSMKFAAEIAGVVKEFEWNGELISGDKTDIVFDLDLPFGVYTGTFNITEANGEAFQSTTEFSADCSEWTESEFDGDQTALKVFIIQDQFGTQTTWDIINSVGEVVASGGPYANLTTGIGTSPNVENVVVPTDDCYMFRIFDSADNGICCAYGEGKYYIKNADNVKIVEGDGQFGSMATHLFAINKRPDAIDENMVSGFNIYPNPANNRIYVDGEGVSVAEVYNSLGQKVVTVEGSDNTSIDVTSLENGVYVVRVITNNGDVTTKKVTIAH